MTNVRLGQKTTAKCQTSCRSFFQVKMSSDVLLTQRCNVSIQGRKQLLKPNSMTKKLFCTCWTTQLTCAQADKHQHCFCNKFLVVTIWQNDKQSQSDNGLHLTNECCFKMAKLQKRCAIMSMSGKCTKQRARHDNRCLRVQSTRSRKMKQKHKKDTAKSFALSSHKD